MRDRIRRWEIAATLTLCAVLLAWAPAALAASFAPGPCPPSTKATRCGYLTVPLLHADPNGPTIQVAVAIYAPAGGVTHPDPVFFLGGGPGWPTLGTDDGLNIRPVTQTGRTLVELDQRGLALSIPKLGCPGLTRLQFIHPDVALAGSVEESVLNDAPGAPLTRALKATAACRARLTAAGVDVAAFNSDESADDIEDLRLALGYGDINLFGTSYGTRLALVVLRRHPEHIRAVILDGVFPPQKGAKDTGEETVEAFGALYAYCAADAPCLAHHPDLKSEVIALAARLDARPAIITVTTEDSEPPVKLRARVTGDTFIAVLAYSLAYANGVYLPRLVAEVGQGDFDHFARLYGQLFDTSSTYGMHNSVECSEDEAFSPPPVLRQIGAALPAYIRGPYLHGQIPDWKLCEAWNVPAAAASFCDPVVSAVPALLLSGSFDWATPPSWAALAARTLSHAATVTFPLIGHQTYFRSACARQTANAWLDHPDEPAPSCKPAPPGG
jgi:pimeloyl-ACP methyl ester carboxylesterase